MRSLRRGGSGTGNGISGQLGAREASGQVAGSRPGRVGKLCRGAGLRRLRDRAPRHSTFPTNLHDQAFSTLMYGRIREPPIPPPPSLLLWGGVHEDGAPFLEPAFVVDAPPTLPDFAGDYRLERTEGRQHRTVLADPRNARCGRRGERLGVRLRSPGRTRVGRCARAHQAVRDPLRSMAILRATGRPARFGRSWTVCRRTPPVSKSTSAVASPIPRRGADAKRTAAREARPPTSTE